MKFICDNWNLPYLNLRQRSTSSIEPAFRGFTSFDPEPAFIPYEAPLHLVLEPTLEDLAEKLDLPAAAPAPPAEDAVSELHHLAETGFLDGLGFDLDQRPEDGYLHRRPELLAEVRSGLGV